MKFRDLNKDEIECRVATVNEKGCSLLLYKDARCDMNILDETLGVTGWRRSHEIIGGNLFCTVEVYDDQKKEWIYKQDVGVESYTEKEKGQASDSFKRACFNKGRNGKLTTYDKFYVEQIIIENKKIVALSIKNKKTKNRVFLYDIRPPKEEETK